VEYSSNRQSSYPAGGILSDWFVRLLYPLGLSAYNVILVLIIFLFVDHVSKVETSGDEIMK